MTNHPTIEAFYAACQLVALQTQSKEMPMGILLTFLGVARWGHDQESGAEPITLEELAARLDAPPTSISQHLRYLGGYYRKERLGLGLVETENNPLNRRQKICRLTPRGKALVELIIKTLKQS